MLKETEYKGHPAYCLENDSLRAVLVPSLGGKLTSIFYKKKDFELLYQNDRETVTSQGFEAGEACGFDDTFPSIDAETVPVNGKSVCYPDHGEIWSSGMTLVKTEELCAAMEYDSRILPYVYQKEIRLTGEELTIKYHIVNTGTFSFPCIWTLHCLVKLEDGLELIYPKDTEDFETTLELEGMKKYYVSHPVKDGTCGYRYLSSGVECTIRYEAEILPYLGVWITNGGFRGDYNMALEPSSGYYDGIGIACAHERCRELKPGETMDFQIRMHFKDIAQGTL